MNTLLPLSRIPSRGGARAAEAAARRNFANRAAALDAARFEIVSSPGCGGDTYGWVLTRAAARAIAEVRVDLENSSHYPRDYREVN